MISLKQVFYILIALNVLAMIIDLIMYRNQNSTIFKLPVQKLANINLVNDTTHHVIEALHNNSRNHKITPSLAEIESKNQKKEQKKANKLAQKIADASKSFKKPTLEVIELLKKSNPFGLLKFYQKIERQYFNSYPNGKAFYGTPMYGLIKDPLYCDKVDIYNIMNPTNIFDNMNFFTDYAMEESLIRESVMKAIGTDTMPYITKFMPKPLHKSQQFYLNKTINMFFTKRVDLHIYHELGKNVGCATQMYNHIPGHGVLKRKDLVVDSVALYAKRYKDLPQCFNKQMFFPFAYRLYIKEECKEFFSEIHSQSFIERSKISPMQYIIKVGFGAHRASGVFLLDDAQMKSLKKSYGDKGEKCGKVKKSLVAQKYIENPLLLDKNNKFDFRIYMLVASTNPLIVYYHDGFLRVSLKEYNQNSNDRSVHLTNTHLAKKIFKDAKNKNVGGMNETELRDYQMWTMEDLQEYLLLAGKISDPNWINNDLRPKFMKAFIHTVRMTEYAFLKQSNVFEMYGLDFMLDSNLNLWFIECNSSPQLIGTNLYKTEFLKKMLMDMFEIQYKYYRSRMKRALVTINKLQIRLLINDKADITDLQEQFIKDFSNKLELEYNINENNSFKLILDKNLKGYDAYFGLLEKECIDDL